LGTIGSVSEATVIVLEFFIGLIFDIFGRKNPLVFGFLMIGIGLIGIPLFKEVYPWFLIMRILISIGAVFGMSVPLLPDYVQKDNMGKAMGIIEVVVVSAYILSSTGLLQIAKLF